MVTVIISKDKKDILNVNPRFQSFRFKVTDAKKGNVNIICRLVSAGEDDIFNDFVMVSDISEKDAELYMMRAAEKMSSDDVIDFSSFAV